jgi:regulator of sigma E protease
MDTSALAGLIFFVAFMGLILVHELGHYFASVWSGVEVEEFGFGIPPRAWTFWRVAGYFLTRSGKRIEIPRNYRMTVPWAEALGKELALTVDRVDDKLILRTIDVVIEMPVEKPVSSIARGQIFVDDSGQPVKSQEEVEVKREVIRVGRQRGQQELTEFITETHAGTDFTLNWLPLGGFVRPKGENDPTVRGGLAAASPWKRLAILFAGPIMNLLMGLAIFTFLVRVDGYHDYTHVSLAQIAPNSPAEAAGMQAGDIVLEAAGQPVVSFDSISGAVAQHLDQPMDFLLQRGDQKITITAVPRKTPPEGEGPLGIVMREVVVPMETWGDALYYGARSVRDQASALLLLPAKMLRGTLAPGEGRFIGLKGIYDIFNVSVSVDVQSREPAATSASAPTYSTLYLIAMLSVSIGLFNLFPFPALDGGRIIFVLPEILMRRRVPYQFENWVHFAGMSLLLLFMLYINVMDFVNPLNLASP